jgi:hypothetical protein
MKPKRKTIPKVVRDAVLSEYRHKCAICGEDSPQLHHIDEDRTNNSAFNLLPLCPKCHLSDQHNPTSRHAPEKLALFRTYKDPAILKPQFQAIFDRISFLYVLDDLHTQARLREDMDDLLAFIRGMEMGAYYAPRIGKLLVAQPYTVSDASLLIDFTVNEALPQEEKERALLERRKKEQAQEKIWAESQRDTFVFVKDEILRLIVESLRFQKW